MSELIERSKINAAIAKAMAEIETVVTILHQLTDF